MKKKIIAVLVIVLLCCMILPAGAEITTLTKCGTHGSAKRLAGRTSIVSIFASDSRWSWDLDYKDCQTYASIYQRLAVGVYWIMEQAAQWNVKCEMVWDWLAPGNEDLFRTVKFNRKMLTGNNDNSYFWDCIDSFDNDAIMRNHNTENILYIFYFNTKKPIDSITGYAMPSYDKLDYNVGFYEYAVLPIGSNYPPGTYAHEILHLFGAPDLYGKNEYLNATDRFVKDFQKRYPREIMAGATSKNYTHVDYVLSPLVAYYVGLTRSSSDQQKWGLRPSEYDEFGY